MEKGRTNGREKGRGKGRQKGRVDWRTAIEGFIIVLHGCILTPILLPPDRILVGAEWFEISICLCKFTTLTTLDGAQVDDA